MSVASAVSTARASVAALFCATILLGVFVEAYAIGSGAHDSFSDFFRDDVRFNPVARPIVLAFACWAVWHLLIQPMYRAPGFSWRDFAALGFGLAWALIEMRARIGS